MLAGASRRWPARAGPASRSRRCTGALDPHRVALVSVTMLLEGRPEEVEGLGRWDPALRGSAYPGAGFGALPASRRRCSRPAILAALGALAVPAAWIAYGAS